MSQQRLVWHLKLSDDIKGKDVLIIDDIYDSGKTLQKAVKYIKSFKPQTVRTCVLLRKKRKRKRALSVKPYYVGFEVPDVFIVGYGLDFAGRFRNLSYIAEIIKK